MFNLFHRQKKEQKNMQELQEQVISCQKRKDFAELSRTYYAMGVLCMEEEQPEQAMLYLSRSDTIFSSQDSIYDAVGEVLMDDCSDRMGELEDMPLLANETLAQIEDKCDDLTDAQIQIWCLLTLSRTAKLGEKLAAIPSAAILGRLGMVTDLVLRTMQGQTTDADCEQLQDFCDKFAVLENTPSFALGEQIDVAGGAPFQIFDLNGQAALDTLYLYLDKHLSIISGIQDDVEIDFIPFALLTDYYVRTHGEDIRKIPQIKAELERIWADYDFVCSEPDWSEITARVESYKALDILQ